MLIIVIIIFLIFLTLFGIFITYTNDITSSLSKESFENENEIELDNESCERRIWDQDSPKGWKCIAPPPKDKLEYISNIDIKYHDTIDDIKAQNPDMDLELSEITFRDNNGNIFSKYTSLQQNNNKYSGDGKYKYGYDNYVPSYKESVILNKIRDTNNENIKLLQQKMINNSSNNDNNSYEYYNSNSLELNQFN